MSDTIKSIVAFTDIAAGASATKPHGLNILAGRDEKPDLCFVNNGAFKVLGATDTEITVKNEGPVSGSVDVLCLFWHSIARAFGTSDPNSTQSLPIRPYVPAAGDGAADKDELVKVSANDTIARYLSQKIGAGSGIGLAIVGGGADEILVITVSGADGTNIATGPPVTVRGPTNAPGVGPLIALADHIHRLGMEAADEGVLVGARPRFNFFGDGVTATDNAPLDQVDINIPTPMGDGGAVTKRSQYVDTHAQTSGAAFVDGMSGTWVTVPIDGDYWAIFEAEGMNQSASGVVEIGISVNSVVAVAPDSERNTQGNASDMRSLITTVQLGALTAGDRVRALFRKVSGSGTVEMDRRHLTIMKVQ